MPELILASTSPTRRALLEAAGLRVTCVGPGVDERAASAGLTDPVEIASRLARAKALAVAARYPEAFVLGADQVVTDGVEVWGKPANPEEHLRQLQRLRGRPHDLVSSYCLLGPATDAAPASDEGVERTRLWVRADLDDDELRAYVATGEGAGCAGGYAIEGRGGQLFERVDGDWYNILGLPMFRVISALRRQGWRLA
jgi:septum formation protein